MWTIKLLKIFQRLSLFLLGIVTGINICYGLAPDRVLMTIGLILAIFICSAMRRIEFASHVHKVELGEDKPDELPQELWDKMQELVAYSECFNESEKENEDK